MKRYSVSDFENNLTTNFESLDNLLNKTDLNKFDRVCLWASGVDLSTISKCSPYERNKYETLGMLIYIPVFTGGLSVILTGTFLYGFSFWLILIALLWCSVLFLIERGLIASMRPSGKNGWSIIFRVILAIATSCLISELLVIFVFQNDVEKQFIECGITARNKVEQEYENRIKDKRSEIENYYQKLQDKKSELTQEIQGKVGSGREGDGPAAKSLREEVLSLENKYFLEKNRIEQEIEDLKVEKQDAVLKSKMQNETNGILSSIKALHQLMEEDGMVAFVYWIAHIFFIGIELMPLLIKLNYKGEEYYKAVDTLSDYNNEQIENWGTLNTESIKIFNAQLLEQFKKKKYLDGILDEAFLKLDKLEELDDRIIKTDENTKQKYSVPGDDDDIAYLHVILNGFVSKTRKDLDYNSYNEYLNHIRAEFEKAKRDTQARRV